MACHLLAGGSPAKLPVDLFDPDYIGPPGPAAEFGHDQKAIANSYKSEEGEGWTDRACFVYHTQMRFTHNLGLVTSAASDKSTRTEAQRVSEWSLQAMAGAPVMALMLDRLPNLVSGLVCCHQLLALTAQASCT